MVKKLLKYDFKSISKYWWIVAISSIVLAFGAGFGFKIIVNYIFERHSAWVQGLGILLFIVSIIGIGVGYGAMQILLIVRYYKNLFTDEGYLTFTLPCKRSEIFFSKILNSSIWYLINFLLLGICAFIFLIVGFTPLDKFIGFELVKELIENIVALCSDIGIWLIAYIPLLIIALVLVCVLESVILYFVVTLASLFVSKGRVIVGIGIYYLISYVLSIIAYSFIRGLAQIFARLSNFDIMDGLTKIPISNAHLVVISIIVMSLCFAGTIATFIYKATCGLIEKKFNIA